MISHLVFLGVTNGGNDGIFGNLNAEEVLEMEKKG